MMVNALRLRSLSTHVVEGAREPSHVMLRAVPCWDRGRANRCWEAVAPDHPSPIHMFYFNAAVAERDTLSALSRSQTPTGTCTR
jgi:hypothetical protein